MNATLLLVGCCLLTQVRGENDARPITKVPLITKVPPSSKTPAVAKNRGGETTASDEFDLDDLDAARRRSAGQRPGTATDDPYDEATGDLPPPSSPLSSPAVAPKKSAPAGPTPPATLRDRVDSGRLRDLKQADEKAPAREELDPPRHPVKAGGASAAADLLAQGLAAPASPATKDAALVGQPMTLLASLSRRSDREGQVRVTHAFWKLSVATAAYHFALDEHEQLLELDDPNQRRDVVLLTSARAAARARLHEAHAVAVAAQHELAEMLMAPPASPLPITADVPHTGSYATRFDELFSSRTSPARTPPGRTRSIHDTLPILHTALVARAEAGSAAATAASVTQAGYAAGKADLDTLLGRIGHLVVQRQAFLGLVRAYNDDIADYALAVAQEGASPADLVGMMIRVKPPASSATRPAAAATRPQWQAKDTTSPRR